MELDPRVDIIEKRLSGLQRILAVTGGKGGIGKSLVASGLALVLAESGCRVGLLDLDFTGPCDHLILGIDRLFPEEKFGLVPPQVHGIRFMSVTHFVGEQPAPLGGRTSPTPSLNYSASHSGGAPIPWSWTCPRVWETLPWTPSA